MNPQQLRRHEQESVAFVGMLLFLLVLILIQMWLFTATLDNFLEGKWNNALPAAAVSLACLGINAWMLIGLGRMERNQ